MIEVGKCYLWTKGIFVRQVKQIDGENVHYRDFEESSGNVISPHSVCSLKYFKTNINRELTKEESHKFSTQSSNSGIPQEFRDIFSKVRLDALKNSSLEDIFNELSSRGINIATN